MTITRIPFPTDPVIPQLVQDVVLEGVSYKLRYHYNDRESLWYLSVNTSENSPIVEGIKIVLDIPLLRKSADNTLPLGEIIAIERDFFSDSAGQPPSLTDLGTRVDLFYIDEEEYLELLGGS